MILYGWSKTSWPRVKAVTATVLLSELRGQGNQNGSGWDEKTDALLSFALNLMMPYKKRVSCCPTRCPTLPQSCPVCLWSRHHVQGVWLFFWWVWEAVEGLINAIFVKLLLRWHEHPVTNRIENTSLLQIGLTGRLCSYVQSGLFIGAIMLANGYSLLIFNTKIAINFCSVC